MEFSVSEMTVGQWFQARKEERARIDPETAEVHWWSDGFEDVHGMNIDPVVIERIKYRGEYFFARNPGSEIWFGLDELPQETQDGFLAKRRAESYEVFLNSPIKDDSGMTVRQWLQIRKEEAIQIDPRSAEVDWSYGETFDPYAIGLELSDDERQVGREYFTRNPGSDIWVWFGDLPEETRNKLWEMHSSKLAFPAGLPIGLF